MKLPECITIGTIKNAANELKLLSGDTSSPIELDFSGVNDIDLSGMQLLVAIMKEAKRRNRKVICTGEIAPGVKARFASCGFAADSIVTAQDVLQSLEALS
jgi:Anti-anti-sigma regulatory factor (antagonist of anti-sigma factor)